METKIVLSITFVVVIILGLFWKQILNFLLLFVPEKKHVNGIIFALKKKKRERYIPNIWNDNYNVNPLNESFSIELTEFILTMKTKNGFVKIKTDESTFSNFKIKEECDLLVTQYPFSNKLVLR